MAFTLKIDGTWSNEATPPDERDLRKKIVAALPYSMCAFRQLDNSGCGVTIGREQAMKFNNFYDAIPAIAGVLRRTGLALYRCTYGLLTIPDRASIDVQSLILELPKDVDVHIETIALNILLQMRNTTIRVEQSDTILSIEIETTSWQANDIRRNVSDALMKSGARRTVSYNDILSSTRKVSLINE